jgi:hypothetical protein
MTSKERRKYEPVKFEIETRAVFFSRTTLSKPQRRRAQTRTESTIAKRPPDEISDIGMTRSIESEPNFTRILRVRPGVIDMKSGWVF